MAHMTMGSSLMLILAFFLICMLSLTSTQGTPDKNNCYADDEYPYLFFSSKTAYQYIYDKKLQPIPNCKAVQIWMLARHGTRYPSKKEIIRMEGLLTLRTQILKNMDRRDIERKLCDKDIENLRKWNYNLTTDLENQLTFQGHDDLLFLAKRMRSKFPILNDASGFSKDQIKRFFDLKYTDTPRTKESAEAFVEGLFGDRSVVEFPPQEDSNKLIKPYDNCSTWENMSHSEENLKEITDFEKGPFIQGLTASISQRLGFQYNLTFDTIDTIYEMCRYEKAWHLQTLPAWCAAFSKQELKVLEYHNDLKYYYKVGYGHLINQRLGCPLVRDMFEKFNKTASMRDPTLTDIGTLGSFYFTHTSMILLLLNRLDIAHDKVPLTSSNFQSQTKRLWRTSLIDPFASNLAAVFYKCSQGEENQIAFYLNEHIVDYPGCNVGLCSWKFLQEKFKNIIKPDSCNIDFCNNSAPRITISPLLVIVSLYTIWNILGTFSFSSRRKM